MASINLNTGYWLWRTERTEAALFNQASLHPRQFVALIQIDKKLPCIENIYWIFSLSGISALKLDLQQFGSILRALPGPPVKFRAVTIYISLSH